MLGLSPYAGTPPTRTVIVERRVTTEEIIIGAVAAVLVVFSLVVALVVPKRRPGFPGRHLAAFLSVCALLAVGTIATVFVLGEEESEAAVEHGTGGEGETPGGETGATAETGATEGGGGAAKGDPAAGADVFASAGCGTCHTLADAGTTGAVGPNLDDAKPSHELVVDRVTNGMGAMPSFKGQLSDEQIQDVAAYVVSATSG